jgi:hypothetical protein
MYEFIAGACSAVNSKKGEVEAMLKKTHALALTVATAGLLGFAAPMASAATMSFGSDPIVNVSNNQIPVQACGNDVNTNGAGTQVLAEGAAVVGSLLSPGAVTENKAISNRGCAMENNQSNRNSGGHGEFNFSDNQLPLQACGNDVNTNGAGTQVPLYGVDGALALLSPKAITKSVAVSNQGCIMKNNQSNKSVHKKHCKPRHDR